jgi:putative drug exporter of the RND superfamily
VTPTARVARLATRHGRWVLLVAALGVVLAAVVGAGVVPRLSSLGFTDPDAESRSAGKALARDFKTADPGIIVLLTARRGTLTSPAAAQVGAEATAVLTSDPGLVLVRSPWTSPAPELRSRDGRRAVLLASASGHEDDQAATVRRVADAMPRAPAVSITIGGPTVGNIEARERTVVDLHRAELVAVPVTLVLLVLAFSGVVAAALPLVIGAMAVSGTLLVLRLLVEVTQVSVFALNLTSALGLGLGIDYALFLVSRFRDERHRGLDVEEALTVTLRTAGRTVAFSAATIAVSLSALMLFPEYFLRSFGYAGTAVVAVAAVAALVVLPAMLAVSDRVLDRLALPFGPRSMTEGGRGWRLVATWVMRRPWTVAGSVLALLAVVCLPFASATFGLPDDRVLPAWAASRQVGDALRSDFTSALNAPVDVVADTGEVPAADDVASYAAELSRLPGVTQVDASTGTYVHGASAAPPGPASALFTSPTGTWFRVLLTGDPYMPQAEQVVERIREGDGPFPVRVTGLTAQSLDTVTSIRERLPEALLLVAAVTVVALFLMTGSVVVPLKALLLSAVSLSATYGVAVWVFQEGHLASLLGVTATGRLDISVVLMVSLLSFGLSVDYEVFLLSRIKEEYDRSGDTAAAVVLGLQQTGRIVTTAAVLFAFVFLSVATSQLSLLKVLGLGTAVAVIVDATLIRALLLPSLMRLMGSFNWWSPAPLRWLHARVAWSEERRPVAPPASPQVSAPARAGSPPQPRHRKDDEASLR